MLFMMAAAKRYFGLFLREAVALGNVVYQRGKELNHTVGAGLKRARLRELRGATGTLPALLGQPLRRSLHGKIRPEIGARFVVCPVIAQKAVIPASYARIIVPNPQVRVYHLSARELQR